MGSIEAYLPREFMIPVGISVVIVSICIVTVTVKLWPFIRRFNFLVSDLQGEKERPGVPARPGVMERLESIEENQKATFKHVRESEQDRKNIWNSLNTIKAQTR